MNNFKPPWGLQGAHIQSVLASTNVRRARIMRTAKSMIEASVDEILDCGEGTRLLLHHSAPRNGLAGKLVVLIHGWEGSAQSNYLLSAATRLWAEGYRVIRLNFRDHGPSHHLNRGIFHSCRLNEMIGAVHRIQEQFSGEAMYLAGFSLGGNFVLRITARAKEHGLDLSATTAICPVIDPNETMIAMETGWFLYQDYFLKKWRRSLALKEAAFPSVYSFGNLKRFRTLREMTECLIVQHTEYPDLHSYLNGYALIGDRLAGIATPSTILLAKDDPVIPISGSDKIAAPDSLTVHQSTFGGHCGFVADYRLTGWLDGYIVRSFDRAAIS